MAKQQPQRPQPRTPQQAQSQAKKTAPAPLPRREKRESTFHAGDPTLIFGRQNFIFMGIGLALILVGLLAMSGGSMPDPNVWEPSRIYSFQRITLAPLLMVAGFVVVGIGIFRKNAPVVSTPDETTPMV